jgi:hypothetical protein
MGWAAKCETKKKEDKAYCLLGIFDVVVPLIYGVGYYTLIRLKEEIHKSLRGKSIISYSAYSPRLADLARHELRE